MPQEWQQNIKIMFLPVDWVAESAEWVFVLKSKFVFQVTFLWGWF